MSAVMSSDASGWLWSELRGGLTKSLFPQDATLFAARMAAWHCLPQEVLPEDARVPSEEAALSVQVLRDAWIRVEHCEDLGALRFAFAESSDFPYSRLSDEVIRHSARAGTAILLLDSAGRSRFCDHLIQAFAHEIELDLPVEIADLALRLVHAKPENKVACVGSAVGLAPVAALRLGSNPLVICNSPPVLASLY